MAKVVVGLYKNLQDAQNAVQSLIDNGFSRNDISLVAGDKEGKYSEFIEKGERREDMEGQDLTEGTVAGAGIGAVVGGLGGLLVGLGALAIPGIGPVLAAGPLVSSLAGAGLGAAAGGLIGALADLGIPKPQAEQYAEGVRQGGTLVTITTSEDRARDAIDIMNQFNPVDIERRAETWQEGTSMQGEPSRMKDEHTMNVVEEELRVGKREEETGGVRARTSITEEPVEEDVTLHTEHVDVERRPVDRDLTDEEAKDAFKEQSFEVRTESEEPVVEKRARIVEEVDIDKTSEEKTETIRDTLRRQDVDVERFGSETMDQFDPSFQSHFQTTYSHTGSTYEDYQPAYYYGYEMGQDDSFRNRNWDDVESDLRMRWESLYADSDWNQHRDAIRHGWLAARGRSMM